MEVALADQGYTGEEPATDAAAEGVKLSNSKKPGVALFSSQNVGWWERSFAWASRFRRSARDYQPPPTSSQTFIGSHS